MQKEGNGQLKKCCGRVRDKLQGFELERLRSTKELMKSRGAFGRRWKVVVIITADMKHLEGRGWDFFASDIHAQYLPHSVNICHNTC